MKYYINLLFFSLTHTCCFSQFQFSGVVPKEYISGKVYLSVVTNYKKSKQLQVNNIISSAKIDSTSSFSFTGEFLDKKDFYYLISIDNCHESITHSKHFLNQCDKLQSVNFIANNTDTIHFSLNNLNQPFCEMEVSRSENRYIQQIDSLQETLLIDLENSLNDTQRKRIHHEYYKQLNLFSQNLNHILAQLYAFNLYANENEFSRKLYLKNYNIKNNITSLLQKKYPETYDKQFTEQSKLDQLLTHKRKDHSILILTLILFISLSTNFYFILKKYKRKMKRKVDPIKVLTKQEIRIVEEIHKGLSNKEIAKVLFISVSTVKTHINNIYSKLNISCREELKQYF